MHTISLAGIVSSETKDMLKKGIIRERKAPGSQVKKPDGKVRYYIDFRSVNAITKLEGVGFR
jgi:hypothetical protein